MTCATPFWAIWQLKNCPQCGGDPREHALVEIAALQALEEVAMEVSSCDRSGASVKDWSQSGEQQMILEWLTRRGLARGRWLDLGAADGVTASNTKALAEQGWPGVAVEAAAHQFDQLTDTYRNNSSVIPIQAAVLVQGQPLTAFHYARDLVSTTEQENAATWSELVDFCTVSVATVTVGELLDQFPGPYDLVSIDTEGTSLELWEELRRLDREREVFAPGALVVVEAENGGERWLIQQACLEGWARVGVTPNNVLLERLP